MLPQCVTVLIQLAIPDQLVAEHHQHSVTVIILYDTTKAEKFNSRKWNLFFWAKGIPLRRKKLISKPWNWEIWN